MVAAVAGATPQLKTLFAPESTDFLLALDEQGCVSYASSGATALLGGGRPSLIGQPLAAFLVPDEGLADSVDWWRLNEPGRLQTVLQPEGNGRYLPATLTIVPLNTLVGATRLVFIATQDSLAQISHSLAHIEKLAELGTLAASVAHELGNPLSIIANTCGNLQWCLDDGSLTPSALADYISMIEQNVWRCIRIIDTLRNFSHREQTATLTADVNQVVVDGLALASETFRQQFGIQLTTALAQSLPPVAGDQHQLTQVLVNLLTNARDALQPGGGQIHVTSRLADGDRYVLLSVADDGPGVPVELRERIFEPFFTTKPVGMGTGLGLPIAAGLVARHGGRILVDGGPEGGAVFTVMLPVTERP